MHGVQHDDLEMAHDGKPGPRPVGWYWQRVCPVSGCDSSDSAGRHSLSIVILKPKAHWKVTKDINTKESTKENCFTAINVISTMRDQINYTSTELVPTMGKFIDVNLVILFLK